VTGVDGANPLSGEGDGYVVFEIYCTPGIGVWLLQRRSGSLAALKNGSKGGVSMVAAGSLTTGD